MAQKTHIMHGRDHTPTGADPIPGLPPKLGGDTLDSLIGAAAPDGWWKLDESSGTTAADSSGNGQDMTSTGDLPPVWAQPAGPPGRQSADFHTVSGGVGGRVHRAWPPLTGDFTAGVWAKRDDATFSRLFGQGNPERSSGLGWQLAIAGTGSIHVDHPYFYVAGVTPQFATNTVAVGAWAFHAVTHNQAAHEWKLYMNGLLEASTAAGTYTPVSSWPLWIGHDGDTALQECHCTLSYAFLINRTLSGAELAAINASTVPIDQTGHVLTVNSAGVQEWLPPTVEVEF